MKDESVRGLRPLRSGALAAVLWALPEQLRLQSKDVIQNAIDAPALETVVGDHARPLEMVAE
jgi:hypothetical protein